jgi:signal transduction histidine kinase
VRSRIVGVVGATASLVLVAFLVPLAVLVRSTATNRAISAATVLAQSLAPAVAGPDDALAAALARTNAASPYQTTVFLPDGRTIGASGARSAAVEQGMAGTSTTAAAPGGREVVVAVAGARDGTAAIRAFVPEEELYRGVMRAWSVLGLLGLCLLAVSLFVADLFARALTRPLYAAADVSFRLAQGNLSARAGEDGPTEVRQVGAGLNLLAGRISELLAQERELVADLSHRLRTPLTALRIDIESVPDTPTRARLLADLDSVDRTVDAVIHEANRPGREGIAVACDAVGVVGERTEFWSVLAEEQGRRIRVRLPAAPVRVRAERSDLEACLDALIGNVFRHTPEGVDLTVMLTPVPSGGAQLTIADDGPGLPTGLVQARGVSGAGSTGLGLDIARRTATRSGGDFELGQSSSGGALVCLRFGPPERMPIRRHRLRR